MRTASAVGLMMGLAFSLLTPPAVHAQEPATPVSRILVKYRPGQSSGGDLALRGRSGAVHARAGRATAAGVGVVSLPAAVTESEAASIARDLASGPDVEWAVPDRRVKAAVAPNDTLYPQQWSLSGPFGVQAEPAWAATSGAADVVVAVLDTGYLDHVDLLGRFVGGYDFISDPVNAADGDGRDADAHDVGDWHVDASTGKTVASSWHGTHVNGIIAALKGNATGVAGLAPNARIQPVRVLGTDGGWLSDVLDGVTWAAGGDVPGVPVNPTPARVINMSLDAVGACDAATQAVLDYAYDRGVVTVVAAGNDATDANTATPAGCRHVVTVGATTPTGARSAYSNFGTAVDVSAPGDAIYSTYNRGGHTPAADTYAQLSGTSMATPLVSAAVALMLSVWPDLTPAQVSSRIRDSRFATPFPGVGCDPDPAVLCGAGILNVAALVGAVPVFDLPTPTRDGFAVTALYANPTVTYTASVSSGTVAAQVTTDGRVVVSVSGLSPSAAATVTLTASSAAGPIASATVTSAALCATPVPTFGTPTAGDGGYTLLISPFDAAMSWSVSSDAGTASVSADGIVRVTDLASQQTAGVTVTARAPGCADSAASIIGAALPDVVLSAVTGLTVGRSRTGLRLLWTAPAPQDGRIIGVKVRLSRVNRTSYGPWVTIVGRSLWRTPVLRHGRYRLQIATVYQGRVGPIVTRRASF